MTYIALMRCLLFGILAFCPLSDGASLTWKEPPPPQVVKEAKDPVEHFSSRELFEGTINATLNWHFGLRALIFNSLLIFFEGNSVARVSPSVTGTPPSYAKRFGFDWIPNQRLMKLFIFNVSMKDNGTFSCRVTADSLDRFSEFHFKSHVQVDVVGATSAPSTTASTNVEREGTTSAISTTASPNVEQKGATNAPSTTAPTNAEQEGTTSAISTTTLPIVEQKAGTLWAISGGATGGVVVLVIGVCVLIWRVHKQGKCRRDTKIHNSDLERHNGEGRDSPVQGANSQSGPPAANGTDSSAEQQIEAEAAIPTYAAVDKSKKKEKSREEVPAVYAEVDKSKNKKKTKIDDKNLYQNLDEPKKEKKTGELLYADLGDFQNPSMPTVSTSPQPLPAIKKADPFERTDYASSSEEMPLYLQMTPMETLE